MPLLLWAVFFGAGVVLGATVLDAVMARYPRLFGS
jgi:hypothetical protein